MDTKDLERLARDAYAMISTLSVTGDAVDVVAAARAKLRKLGNELEKRAAAEEKLKDSGADATCAAQSREA